MSTTTRMRLILSIIFVFAVAGCGEKPAPFDVKDRSPKADRDAPFDPPNMYPDWTYDSEKYVRPVEDLKPEPRVKPGDPLHYFTNKRIVMIRQPSGYTPEEVPRVAVWWTEDNGFHWNKGGSFGRQQSYFPFEATDDGDYGIRFVGPNQPTANQVPPVPERVYHVDTILPEVAVWIEPEQSWYHVGDTITIRWEASDYHLIEYPVRIGVFSDFASGRHELVELQRDLADKGAITYKIPPEALDHELRFRVDARDRASNVGTAISFALQVVNEAATEKNESEKSEESSARDTKDKSSSAVDSVGDAAQGRGERHGGKAASKTPDLWYQEALSKITDLSDEKNGGAPPSSGVGRASAADQTPSPPAGEEESHADAGEGSVGEAAVQPEAEAKVDDARADESVARAAMPDRESSDAADESEATADEPEGQTELITPPVFALEEPGTPQSDESSALSTVTVSVLDPTHGNGLLVPLPATIEPQSPRTQFVTAHPWRILGGSLGKSVESIWALPKPRFALELYRTIEGRFLADRAMLRPVAMPGGPDQTFAGGGNPYAPPPAQLIEEP